MTAANDPHAARAAEAEARMTDDERLAMVIGVMGAMAINPRRDPRIPDDVPMSAAYTAGVERLGVPALLMSDASLGITNPGYRHGDTATALPAAIALGASFNPELARQAGVMIGKEARSRGFNVMLAGGINLMRDPRNGRNFEYLSEDPWHSGVLAAASVNGIQSQGVISTLKHFTLNSNETNRHWLDAVIDPAAHRESDLLAFELAIERAQPGAIMGAYNKINGRYAGDNNELLNGVLKGAWGYKGWVMSDWGATLDWKFALNGLDQDCGVQIDAGLWGQEAFPSGMPAALASGEMPRERLSEMVQRILRSMFAIGVDRWGDPPAMDLEAHHEIALETARQGIVLLENDGVLPLDAATSPHIAVIGGYAQVRVPCGTGSSAVVPAGGYAAVIPIGGPGAMGAGRNLFLMPSSPLRELRHLMRSTGVLRGTNIEFDPGLTPADAALAARRADIAIVFAVRVEGEGFDSADLSLPWGQDAIIEAVAAANPNTIVVLETGNPVAMPWRDNVRAIVQAWYSGQAGGQAIAEALTGAINPGGRLPITFPASLSQTPRPELPGLGTPWGTATTINYNEAAEVGYRWFAQTGAAPLYAFGHGKSYTTFAYSDLVVEGGDTIAATFTVTNTGARDGADVPQVYLLDAPDGTRQRLLGFDRVQLAAGESRRVTIVADPRLIGRFDSASGAWRVKDGRYSVAVSRSAADHVLRGEADLAARPRG